MKTIDSKKIIGAKIWKNDDKWHTITHGVRENDNSWRIIEFKSCEDIDKLIKDLKKFKKDFIEIENNGHV